MEHFISITEMAKLRNVTTETLRYYDRIGLLKPDYLDKNNVRYYSVLKYEQLETIKELQQMGLELKEISRYLSDRRIDTSYELLLQQQKLCREKIKLYKALESKINRKVKLLSTLKQSEINFMEPEIIYIKKRFYLSAEHDVSDEISLGYACMNLENKIKEKDSLIPVYASDCYAGMFSLQSDNLENTKIIFILNSKTSDSSEPDVIPEGNYIHLYSSNSFWDRTSIRQISYDYAKKHKLQICDNAIAISRIDYSITDIPNERLFEFQVRVLKHIQD